MIKLLSGYSNPGGSTVAHINLINLFNKNGIAAEFYGPNEWHLDKCKGKLHKDFKIESGDNLILHFIGLQKREPLAKKVILSCHETNVFPINEVVKSTGVFWDKIHFVSEFQRDWQNVPNESVIIPNVVSPIKRTRNNTEVLLATAGVIGSIDSHKRPHMSIQRATLAGYSNIKLFGDLTDPGYFKAEVLPLLNDKVVYCGHLSDKNKVYNSIDCVFHSSQRETFNYVMHECKRANIPYYGLPECDPKSELWSDDKILAAWKELLEI